MGNTPSSQYEQINNKNEFTFTYQLLRKTNEPHYGEVKVVRDIKTGEQIFLKEVVLTTKETYQAELNFYNKRNAVSHPNVVRIYGCNGTDQQNFCSSYYKISVFIEMLPKTLAQELENRFDTLLPFSENDILLIAENLIAGLSYFEAQDVFHGDIRPENIFLATNSYKLSDPNLCPQKNANALSHVLLGQARTLLAPQLVAQVPHGDFQIKCNKFKADVFSLGMTLMSLASLTDARELYDYEGGTISTEGIAERMELVRKSYSKFTFELIRDMLKFDEEDRPDFIALSNRLLPYQEDIRQKSELPFFGIRAPYQEKKEEDHLDITRYTYEEKSNPILMDFINSQMTTSTKRKPQRESPESSGRAEDIMPSHNAFDRERDSAHENFRKAGNLMAEFERTEVNQNAYYQQENPAYMQSQLAEQLYRENPTRNPFQGAQYENQGRRVQEYSQQQQEQGVVYGNVQGHTSRSTRNEPQVDTYQQVHYEAQKRSAYPKQDSMPQLDVSAQQQKQQYQQQQQVQTQVQAPVRTQSQPQYQQQQQQIQPQVQQQREAYFQPQINYIDNQSQQALHIEPKIPLFLSESQIQSQIQRQENTPAEHHAESNDLDDLEAKIKAALERSEATYKRASRPLYASSPNPKQESPKKASPVEQVVNTSGYGRSVEGDEVNSAQYLKPTNLYVKGNDLNNSPPTQSEVPTNGLSNDNTMYDFNPTFLSQSNMSYGNQSYAGLYGQNMNYQGQIQYQQQNGDQYNRVDRNFYSFGGPMEGLQRHAEHNGIINGEQKNLIQQVIQD